LTIVSVQQRDICITVIFSGDSHANA